MRRLTAILFRSFLQGLLLLSPIVITGYILYNVFNSVDGLLSVDGGLLPFKIPRGLGFVIIISFVTMVGYLGTRLFVGRWLFDAFGHVLENTPGIKFIYSSIRDIMSSFVGDKKRFNKPVWVCVNSGPEIWRIGFMTQKDMAYLGLENMAAVYMPHAYAISGWVIVTEGKNIRPVKEMTAGEAMKFAVSGGVTTVEDEHRKD